MPKEHAVEDYEIDNFSLDETDIILENEERVRVYPWKLVENAIENSFEDSTLLVARLQALHDELDAEVDRVMNEWLAHSE